ncbi:hypothetical protein HMPREF1862_01752 [Varibaculum cambriense]|uniref:Uncharacterized protein n=1 Tax=Varibaculum cambriense TaxID=184870 RepID=A0AB34WX51_9ACTO|nr:hypothetical protein HMPREF1862_01752 [Varibaculum cambriense]
MCPGTIQTRVLYLGIWQKQDARRKEIRSRVKTLRRRPQHF